MHRAVRRVALTSLRQKRSGRCNRSAGQRLSDRTVARRYRHICARDICQRIAEEAEAVDRLISQRGALRTEERRCCSLWRGRDPVGERLRNVRSGLKSRPDCARLVRRRLARTLHVAAGQVGNRHTENNRTRAIRRRENRRAAGCGSDRDCLSGLRRAGRGGAKRKISSTELEIVNLLGLTG